MVRVDAVHPGQVGVGKVVDKAQAGPVAVAAEAVGVVDGAPAILAERDLLAGPASRSTTKMAFTPRPWTTAIAPR
jgi:hypothetical protein